MRRLGWFLAGLVVGWGSTYKAKGGTGVAELRAAREALVKANERALEVERERELDAWLARHGNGA